MYEYSYKFLTDTRYGGGKSKTLRYSCPKGMTKEDLSRLFPSEKGLNDFWRWMAGQTASICNGKDGHHVRVHNEECMKSHTSLGVTDKAHTESSEFNWRCGYAGFYETDSVCKDNPHGTVVYPHDVARYLFRLPVID